MDTTDTYTYNSGVDVSQQVDIAHIWGPHPFRHCVISDAGEKRRGVLVFQVC